MPLTCLSTLFPPACARLSAGASGCARAHDVIASTLVGAALLLLLLATSSLAAPPFATSAPNAILVDHETGTVLLEKNADEPHPPASLVKLMTLEVLFEELKRGRVKLDDEFPVSERAWRDGGASSGGSTMFLRPNSKVSVRDLIRGIAVQSGNDATIVVAEALAGSEEDFARVMERRAKELGLENSSFGNSHGLPHPDQRMSVRDLATLAAHIIREHPELYRFFAEEEFTHNGITQRNRNPVLELGADGLKTGYTSESGYGLVASVERGERRLILALAGMKTPAERESEAGKLLEWGFRAFENVTLYRAGEQVGEAPVALGDRETVPVVTKSDVKVTSARGFAMPKAEVVADPELTAPVEAGAKAGRLVVRDGERTLVDMPVYAREAVGLASLPVRAWHAALRAAQEAWTSAWSWASGEPAQE